MKQVSSQPLLCLVLFLAGCVCFLVALNPEWLAGESMGGAPAGGGRIPGLEPPKPPAKVEEEEVKPEAPKAPAHERKPEEASPGKDPAPSSGTP